MDTQKITFQLTTYDSRLLVRASSPQGEAKTETALPSPALLDRLVPSTAFLTSVRSVGRELFVCLNQGAVGQLVAEALDERRQARESALHFELRFDADQLALTEYPWEMLVDERGHFLVRDGLVDLTRYLNYPQPLPPFDFGLEESTLLLLFSEAALLSPTSEAASTPLNIQTLHPASHEQLRYKLLIERLKLWGLQFDGPGSLLTLCPDCETLNSLAETRCLVCRAVLDRAERVSALGFLADEALEWVTVRELGGELYNAGVQLAFLLAAETQMMEARRSFNGLTPNLLLAGVPAVLGMQYPINAAFAAGFTTVFYDTLSKERDLLTAVRNARIMNAGGAWYSPTLYLRHQKPLTVEPQQTAAYHPRNIDTAVPAQVQPHKPFLARLWIRRPQSRPLPEAELRLELDVPDPMPVSSQVALATFRFEPVKVPPGLTENRTLRLGQVEIKLHSPACQITPAVMTLFVDEQLDAPPAIFTVTASEPGRAPLFFTVWQGEGQIAAVTHHIEVVPSPGKIDVAHHSNPIYVEDDPASREAHLRELIITHQRVVEKLQSQKAAFGLHTPPHILLQIEDTEAEITTLRQALRALGESPPAHAKQYDPAIPPPAPPPMPSPPQDSGTKFQDEMSAPSDKDMDDDTTVILDPIDDPFALTDDDLGDDDETTIVFSDEIDDLSGDEATMVSIDPVNVTKSGVPTTYFSCTAGPHTGKTFQIQSRIITIGRANDNTIALVKDKETSRRHAKITQQPDGTFVIEDLGSLNGVIINDVQIDRSQTLHQGDTILIGITSLTFRIGDATTAPELSGKGGEKDTGVLPPLTPLPSPSSPAKPISSPINSPPQPASPLDHSSTRRSNLSFRGLFIGLLIPILIILALVLMVILR